MELNCERQRLESKGRGKAKMSPWLGEEVACNLVAGYIDASTEHVTQVILVFLKHFLTCSSSSIPLTCVPPVLPQ